jgi:putative addiction module component (TIGR02574 family)
MSLQNLLKEALSLKPVEKAELIEKLLSSLDMSNKEIDKLWAKEVEERINALDRGKINSNSLDKMIIEQFEKKNKIKNQNL